MTADDRVAADVQTTISDDALVCFARWCRENDWRLVLDPVVLRRVLTAYTNLANLDRPGADR